MFLNNKAISVAIALAAPSAGLAQITAPPSLHYNNSHYQMSALALTKQTAILGTASALSRIAGQQNPQLAALPASIAEPAKIVDAPVATDRPDIFGSTALPISTTPLDAKWRRVSTSRVGIAAWKHQSAPRTTSDRRAIVQSVNSWVNRRITFTDDRDKAGLNDRWTSAGETLRKGRGDCEDYAIAKLQLLRAQGFAAEDLYLTIVKDLVRRSDHAVLIVRLDGRFIVLDNMTDRLVDGSNASDYRPVFSFAAGKAWLHGYRRPNVQLAGMAASPR